MAASDAPFVGLFAQPDAEVLRGDAARTPLVAGQMIMGCGTHSNGFSTGLGVFLVLRQVSARTYALAPFGSKDAGWAEWLSGKLAVKAVLMRGAKESIPKVDELLRRWRIISEKGEKPQMKDYVAYGKKVTDAIEEKWKFLNELVVSEKPLPQAATVPLFR